MKKPPIPPAQAGHQTVPEFISRPTPGTAIPIGFTNQKVSGHAGLVPFWGCLHWQHFHALLAGVRPHVRTGPKAIPPADLALGFIDIPPPCAAISRRGHCHQRTDPIGSPRGLTTVFAVAIAGLVLYGVTRTFTDANMMPILCLIADPRYRATGYGMLNFIACIVGGLGVYAGGALRDAKIELSSMFLFVFGCICVCTALLFALKPKLTPAVATARA